LTRLTDLPPDQVLASAEPLAKIGQLAWYSY
jgi:hypothetical protein